MSFRTYIIILTALCGGAAFGFIFSRFFESTERSMLRGWDNTFYYSWVRSVIKDGDIDFENELRINNTIAANDAGQLENLQILDTGYYPNKYGIGWGLATAPFFLCAELNSWLFQLIGVEHRADGYGFVHQFWVQIGHLFYGLISLLITYKIARFWFSRTLSFFGVLSAWAGGLLFYYQTVNLSMAHNLTYLLIVAIYYLALLIDREKRFGVLPVLAFLAGLLCVTRYQAGVYLIYPCFLLLNLFFKNRTVFSSSHLVGGILLLAVPLILQSIAWKILYGDFMVFSYGVENEGFNWLNIAGWSVLFSPNHGLFYWHPLLFLGLVGFTLWVIRERQWVFLAWSISLLLTWYVTAAWWCWWLGSSFGQRNFEGVILLSVLGIPYLYQQLKGSLLRATYLFAVLFLVIWNLNLCLLYTTNFISRNSSVSYSEMISGTKELLIWLIS